MLKYLNEIDQKLLVFLNNCYSPFWDEVMLKSTDRFFWIPFYALIVFFLVWKYRKDSILLVSMICLSVICSDLLTSSIMKPFFGRLRPCYNESLEGLLRVLNGCGGEYGFVSSHASNTFTLSIFLMLLLQKDYKWIYLIIVWASLVSYSRIYLAVHYPGDILGGAVVGVILGIVAYRLYLWISCQLKRVYPGL